VNEGQQTNLTPGIRYYHEDLERKRENSQITLQFRPMDSLTMTLDSLKAEQDLLLNGAEFSFWFGGGTFPATDVQFDGNPRVATPVYFWAENPTGDVRDVGVTQNYGDVTNELESTGLNVEFVATDSLTLTLDHHSSEASSLPGSDDIIGSYFNIATGAQGVWSQGYDNSGDLPLLVGNFAARTDVDPGPDGDPLTLGDNFPESTGDSGGFDVADLGSTVRQGWFSRTWGEIDQTRIDANWALSDTLSIDFGVESRDMEATQKASFLQEVLEGNWGVGTPGDVTAEMEMEQLNFASLFDGYSTTLSPDAQAFFDQAGDAVGSPSGARADVFTTGFIAKDVKALGKALSANAGLAWEPAPNDGTNRTIQEEITSFYVQGTFETELAGMGLTAVAGVRHEQTDVTSIGQVGTVSFEWQGDNDFATISGDAADAPVQIGIGDYDHTLPSLTLSLNISEDLVGRFGYSTTISRPDYGRLLEGINGVQPPSGGPSIIANIADNPNPGDASNGNTGLMPLESDNIDLSLEWYFGESSYAAIGYFQKDVPNFVGDQIEDQVVSTTLDQSNGPRAEAAIDQLIADGFAASAEEVTQQQVFQMIASMNLDPSGCITRDETAPTVFSCGDAYGTDLDYEDWEASVDLVAVESGAFADPNYIARVSFPVDTQKAELDGWEAAVQHFFGETGFGVQANYTVVNGDIEYDITGNPTITQFALAGLSDSANLVLIYEDDKWSSRLAYNWRDAFLVSPTAASNEPQHTEEYTQLDLSVGYNVSDNLAVTFEGINLTGEDQRDFARTERQLLRLNIQDVRYALGIRYDFE
jgi:TonB-dependent receptor